MVYRVAQDKALLDGWITNDETGTICRIEPRRRKEGGYELTGGRWSWHPDENASVMALDDPRATDSKTWGASLVQVILFKRIFQPNGLFEHLLHRSLAFGHCGFRWGCLRWPQG